jgi:hypothetical protein
MRTEWVDQKAGRSVSRRFVTKWAIAALLIIGVGVTSVVLIRRSTHSVGAVYAMVESVYGPVYRVSETNSEVLSKDAKLESGERIRTAKDGGAVVVLPDGSSIEMKERSEFSVTESSAGITINLERGNIIIQAAKQRPRHLFVSTSDCLVSVNGTIFSVNSGTKGSRISVIEGEVHVDHGGDKDVLLAGDQVSTNASIEQIPVKDEISWSKDRERYDRMLSEIEAIRREIDQKVPRPGIRHSTRLLDMVPEGTVLYVAIPNLSETLAESRRIMETRLQQNPALQEWLAREQTSRRGLDNIIDKVTQFGSYLGDEIVVSATMDARGEPDTPVVLAELRDAAGFRAFVDQQVSALNIESRKGHGVSFVEDPQALAGQVEEARSGNDLFIWIHNDILVAGPKAGVLNEVAATVKSSSAGAFVRTPFQARLAELYEEGAGLIVAADLERIIAASIKDGSRKSSDKSDVSALRELGVTNLKHFILELKESQGKSQNRAVLTFDESDRGVASWLAAPGPMGALEFISPDATVVAAFVVEQPVALVDDLLGALKTIDPKLWQHLKDGEAEHGIDLRNDVAAPLGGEFAFAIDGPVLPVPSWKMIFEVNDPGHLQQTFETIVNRLNQYAAREGKRGFEWETAELGGRTYHTLKSIDFGLSVSYTFANGYLIAGPSRALVDRAAKYRESGYTLLHSPRFVAALPEDKNANFSALFYQNLAPILGPVSRQLGGASKALPEEGSRALRSLAGAAPVLAYAYAQNDRIIFAANGEDGPLGLKPSSLLGMPGSFGLQHILGEAMR